MTSHNTEKTRVLLLSMPDTFMGFNLAAKLPNLGLVSIAANNNPNESIIRVADLILRQKRVLKSLRNLLDRFNPEIVGLNVMTFQWHTARKITKWIKEEYNSNIAIVLGGYHATTCAEELGANIEGARTAANNDYKKLTSCPWCDFIVRGEGEVTFREFIHAYRTDQDYTSIEGLSWRDTQEKMIHNERRSCLDLSQIKLPDRSTRLIKKTYYITGRQAAAVETSRGCTNACKFCSIRQMYGRNTGIRYYPLERVMKDIYACVEGGARAILFIDDNITLNPERLENLCDLIIADKKSGKLPKDLEFETQASAHGLMMRKSLIPKMGKAGFGICFFGIENISKKNLKLYKKSIPKADKMKELVRRLHENDMISFGGFILGNPTDNIADIRRNIHFARYLDLDVPAFQILTPFPKTELRSELAEKGLLIEPYDYTRYHGLYANVRTEYLDQPTLQHELMRAYYRYYHPMWLIRRLKRLGIIKKYGRYFWQIIKKYWKLAISSWMKTWRAKLIGAGDETSEDVAISWFEDYRDSRLNGLIGDDT